MEFQTYLNTIKNLHVIGRYGAFKYNNQDHSILMGKLAAENILQNKKKLNDTLKIINTQFIAIETLPTAILREAFSFEIYEK